MRVETLFGYSAVEFSGGGQGNGPKPPPKIQGGKWRGDRIKAKNIPPPQPKTSGFGK